MKPTIHPSTLSVAVALLSCQSDSACQVSAPALRVASVGEAEAEHCVECPHCGARYLAREASALADEFPLACAACAVPLELVRFAGRCLRLQPAGSALLTVKVINRGVDASNAGLATLLAGVMTATHSMQALSRGLRHRAVYGPPEWALGKARNAVALAEEKRRRKAERKQQEQTRRAAKQ